jgi:hypothetical protein
MNRTVKDAPIKVFHSPDRESLKAHVLAFVTAYNLAKHLKRLPWRTPVQAICKAWTRDPAPFKTTRTTSARDHTASTSPFSGSGFHGTGKPEDSSFPSDPYLFFGSCSEPSRKLTPPFFPEFDPSTAIGRGKMEFVLSLIKVEANAWQPLPLEASENELGAHSLNPSHEAHLERFVLNVIRFPAD